MTRCPKVAAIQLNSTGLAATFPPSHVKRAMLLQKKSAISINELQMKNQVDGAWPDASESPTSAAAAEGSRRQRLDSIDLNAVASNRPLINYYQYQHKFDYYF